MKQNIRLNTFETNSSSVHSICIMSKEEFDEFKEGNLYIDGWKNDKLYTIDDIKEIYLKGDDYYINEYLEDEGITKEEYLKEHSEEELIEEAVKYDVLYGSREYYNYDSYIGDRQDYYETFEEDYTTKNGEEIVAFGYYGHD